MRSYYSKVLIPFVNDLIADNAKRGHDGLTLNAQNLCFEDRGTFVAHLIAVDDHDLYSVYENDNNSSIVDSLINMLKANTEESRLQFAWTLTEQLQSFYLPKMQKVIDECLISFEDESDDIGAYKSYRDLDFCGVAI